MRGELKFFEIGVADTARARTFYESLFGWQFEPVPDGDGFEITTPNVRGGMHGEDAGAAPYVFFEVEDMERALERVRELGGAVEEADVEGDEENVATFGRFTLCRDDQGSPFGLHQPPTAEGERQGGRMTNAFRPLPEGFHTVTPYLMVPDADALVEFMGRAFGAEETFRVRGEQGGLHIEVRVGDSMIMVGGVQDMEPQPASIFLYMDRVDDVYGRALEAGATPIEEPSNRPADGDRRAGVADPFGNAWFVATRIEDLSREELQRRHEDLLA